MPGDKSLAKAVQRLDHGQLEVVAQFLAGLAGSVLAEELEGGACAETDPDTFYPEKGDPVTAAKRICRGCDIREQCLESSLARDERFGVWGGVSARDRALFKIERARRTGEESAA